MASQAAVVHAVDAAAVVLSKKTNSTRHNNNVTFTIINDIPLIKRGLPASSPFPFTILIIRQFSAAFLFLSSIEELNYPLIARHIHA